LVVLVLALGLGVLGVSGFAAWWVVGHPERVRAGLVWIAERPAVDWVRSHYPRQWRFLGRRFAPGEAAGLTLTVGAAAVLALGVSFEQMLDSVLERDGITMVDRPVLHFLATHRQPWSITCSSREMATFGGATRCTSLRRPSFPNRWTLASISRTASPRNLDGLGALR